jgi:hypothetical protein
LHMSIHMHHANYYACAEQALCPGSTAPIT